MELILKKTSELSDVEKEQICQVFLEVFEKHKSIEEFNRQFLNTPFGYSYHALMVVDNEIVGINSIIPYAYNYFGKDTFFALSVDTMTKKEFRNLGTFKKLAKMVYAGASEDGVSFVLGFPNDVSYKIFKKMLRWQDIGRLSFYALPISIGAFKPSVSILSPLSYVLARGLCSLSKCFFPSTQLVRRNISKVSSELFKKQRYSEDHHVVNIDGCELIYKFDDYEGVNVAYILDVTPLTQKNIQISTEYLVKKYSKSVDAVLYLGNLDIVLTNLIKIPLKFEPKNIYVSGLILDNEIIDDRVWSLKNWNLNLSNMDVL